MGTLVRNTRQKDAIRHAFAKADRPLSQGEVLVFARKSVESTSLATVYRNISALVEEKWLVAVDVPGSAPRYEVAGKEHHHHFQCNACEKLFELPGCAVEVKPSMPRGFQVTGHEFFLYGTCPACR